MFVIAVYVTSRYRDYIEFSAALDEAIGKYIPDGSPSALCTGSSKSNNSGNGMVRRYAFEHRIPCRVFETQWSKHIPTKPGKRNTAGVRANAMIVKNSSAAIMFWCPTSVAKWDFMSGGCYNFQKMCGKMRRELIPIKVDIYKPLTKPVEAPTADVEEEPIGDIGGGMRASDMMGGAPSPSPSVSGGAPSIDMTPSPAPSMGAPSMDIPVGGGSEPPPSETAAAPTGDGGAIASIDSVQGDVVDLPLDVNGDGAPDTSIPAIDTDADGTPDSMVTPMDTDGNGTVDSVKIDPLPQSILPNAAPSPQPTAAPTQSATPTPPPMNTSTPAKSTGVPDEDEKAVQ